MKKTLLDFIKKIQDQWNRFQKTRAGRITGIVLVSVGVLVMLSAIVVPIYNRLHNDAIIKDIKNGSYSQSKPVEDKKNTATSQPVSENAAATGNALNAQEGEMLSREQRANEILKSQDVIGIVEVESIGAEYAVVEGSENANIRGAVGHLTKTAQIGQPGNCVIAGHRGGYYGDFFKNLDKVNVDDVIILTDTNRTEYYYSVYDIKVIEAWDWTVTENLGDKTTVTLLTCEDNAKKRIAVSAILFDTR